jgi:hypothetical protein
LRSALLRRGHSFESAWCRSPVRLVILAPVGFCLADLWELQYMKLLVRSEKMSLLRLVYLVVRPHKFLMI